MIALHSRRERAILALLLILYVIFLLAPVAWMIITSFKSQSEIFRISPTIIPLQPTLANYRKALFETNIALYLGNALVVCLGNGFLTTFLAGLAAYGFAKFRFTGQRWLMLLMIAAQMFPYAVLLISLYPMLRWAGLFDTRIGLVFAYLALAMPSSIYILFSYLLNVPKDLLEAARMDGAGEVRILREVVVPLIVPGLVTVFLYSFMWSWNDLLFSLTLITSESKRTIGAGLLQTFLGEMEQDWGAAMAGSAIVSAPIIIAFALLQRFFIQGLTSGAVK